MLLVFRVSVSVGTGHVSWRTSQVRGRTTADTFYQILHQFTPLFCLLVLRSPYWSSHLKNSIYSIKFIILSKGYSKRFTIIDISTKSLSKLVSTAVHTKRISIMLLVSTEDCNASWPKRYSQRSLQKYLLQVFM